MIKVKYQNFSLPTDNSISVSFRFCKPGEEISIDSTWKQCSAGTYSLNWNSTQCMPCIENSVWLGGTDIEVNPDYWRHTTNSTTTVLWPRSDSCRGGYEPNNKHPVNCQKGYTGYLWTEWVVTDSEKYRRVGTYQWSKCPNAVSNAIRISILMILAFSYLTVLIIVTIK